MPLALPDGRSFIGTQTLARSLATCEQMDPRTDLSDFMAAEGMPCAREVYLRGAEVASGAVRLPSRGIRGERRCRAHDGYTLTYVERDDLVIGIYMSRGRPGTA